MFTEHQSQNLECLTVCPGYGVMHACVLSLLSCVRLWETLWTAARQAPLSMGFSRSRILGWVAMPSSRRFSQPRDWTGLLCLLHWQVGSSPLVPPGKPLWGAGDFITSISQVRTQSQGPAWRIWLVTSTHSGEEPRGAGNHSLPAVGWPETDLQSAGNQSPPSKPQSFCPYQDLHKDPAPPSGTPHSKRPGILPALDTSCLHCLNCFPLLTERIQAHCSEPSNTERYQERKQQRSLEFHASETEFMSRNDTHSLN